MSLKEFEIISKIGEGAYSVVYKVKRKPDQEIYALKKVFMRKLKKKEKSNSLNEIRILASINHTNIISYKQAFFDEDSESLCIVMEYADAGDLYQKILEHKKKSSIMSEDFLWRLLMKLAKALECLHDLNIMHRDLKSANVFLTKDGKVKLGDMNVSKVAKESMNHTQTGTPYYASPEVWRDDPYDFKSDIWSLGCVLYEAAALKPPFQAEDMNSLYKKVIKGVTAPLINYSTEFNSAVRSLLNLDPKKRPTASEIISLVPGNFRSFNKEKSETLNSSLLNTIRISSDLFNIKDQLPGDKYFKPDFENNRVLPQIGKIQRGATHKVIENPSKKHQEFIMGYYRNLSEKPIKYSQPKIKSILRENYGALKLPSVKYPHSIKQIKDISRTKLRKREITDLPSLPERT
jgi:NIMA (never in mitosis gene a)-related kinase 1/4/5